MTDSGNRMVKPGVKQTTRVIFSVAVSFALMAMFVQNYRHQRETDRRVAEMQKMLRGIPAGRQANTEESIAPSVADVGSSGYEVATKRHDVGEILNAGWKLVDQRTPDQAAKAVNVFKDGIANVDPKSPELYNGFGRPLLVAGKPVEAIEAWRKGLALAPNFSDMQSGIGWAYWSLNDPCRAKDAWQKALAMNPHLPDAWSAMAWIDLALGKNSDAKNGFQELIKFDSGQKSWLMGLSMVRGGNADIREISQFFPLPPLEAFNQPLPVDPVSVPTQVGNRP